MRNIASLEPSTTTASIRRNESRRIRAAVKNVAEILSIYTDNNSEFGGVPNISADVVDLMADLMHFCRNRRVDFDDCLRTARGHVDAEVLIRKTGATL